MTDTNNSGEKSLGPAKPTLHLKRPVDAGTVRQSFSHGRSKVVVVEKKRRVVGPGETAAPAGAGTISLAAQACRCAGVGACAGRSARAHASGAARPDAPAAAHRRRVADPDRGAARGPRPRA